MAELNIWTDVDAATVARHEQGTNLLIALTLYNVGGGTVESLSADWELSVQEQREFLAHVKLGWKQRRWDERREGLADRRFDDGEV